MKQDEMSNMEEEKKSNVICIKTKQPVTHSKQFLDIELNNWVKKVMGKDLVGFAVVGLLEQREVIMHYDFIDPVSWGEILGMVNILDRSIGKELLNNEIDI
jgi:hypothetical protein